MKKDTSILSQYRRLLTDQGRSALNQSLLISAIAGVIEGAALLSVLMAAAAIATGQSALGLGSGTWVVVLALLAALGFFISYQLAMRSYRSALDIMRNCHKVVGDAIAGLPLGWFGQAEAGRYSRAMTSGMMSMGQAVAHILSKLISQSAAVLTLLVGLLYWQPLLGLVLALCIPLYALVVWGGGRAGYASKQRSEPAKTALAQRLVEYADCQRSLRSAGRAYDPPHLGAALRAEEKSAMRHLLAESGILAVIGMFGQAIICGLIIYAGQLAVAQTLSPLATIAFIGVCMRALTSLVAVGEMLVGMQDQTPILGAISEVLETPTMPEPQLSKPVADSQVELRDVCFGYDPHIPVLNGVSFTMAPQTLTALVGPSGSGKTTIARLIARFYDVDSGSILVGGADVRELHTSDLMAQLSMVFQDVYLYNDTLEANIRVGRPDASTEEIHEVARIAGVTEIVGRLPGGWDSRVGEGGGRLSGGERQRVSIARALLKRAPIVLMDEATSALDAENETNIKAAIERLRQTSTVLVIAHKLNTISNADQVVVLCDQGKVAQLGVHAELIEQPGIYQGYWQQRQQATNWALV